MTILLAELVTYHAEIVNDTTANGGRRSNTNDIVSGAVQNVFEHVFRAQRIAGLTRFRKVFYCNTNDNDEIAHNAQPFFHHPPGGDHYLWWHLGTYDDTQDDITGSERKYGSVTLSTAATAGLKTLVVTCKHADETDKFASGDPIMVSNKATPDSSTGNEELHTIDGAPVVAGLQVTITTVDNLANSYAVDVTSVTSGVNLGEIGCSVDNWAETFAGDGAYDEVGYPVECDNIGTVYDTWTITFTDAANFTCAGANEGNVGSGTVGSDFSPVNSARSNKLFFILRAAGHSGTPQAGDTIVFRTKPAEVAVWETLEVPANAAPLGSAGFYSYLDCETV